MVHNHHIVIICLGLLYFLQGVPYGLQIKALPLYFYQVLDYPISTVTKLSFLMTPWIVLKPLIAIYLKSDTSVTKFVYAGILGNTVFNFVLYILMSDLVEASANIHSILLVLFLVNCSTVVIDVATDRLAITSAASDDDLVFLGMSNSIQVVAYKLGSIFAIFLINYLSYENIGTLFIALSAFYFISLFIVFILLQALGISQKPIPVTTKSSTLKNVNKLYSDLENVMSIPGTICLLVFVLFYKMGEVGSSSIYPLLLLQRGITKEMVSFITTAISEPVSLIGSLIGGFIWKIHKPAKPILSLTLLLCGIGCARVIPLLMQYASLTQNPGFLEICGGVGFLSLMGGIVSTLTFTLMMTLSYKALEQYQASHYALISSFEVFGKLLFSAYVGTLSDYLTVFQVYAMFSVITVLSSAWLFFCKHSLCHQVKSTKVE